MKASQHVQSDTWSDYDGDSLYGDFDPDGGTPITTGWYQPGLWQATPVGDRYLHGDMIGTLRTTTDEIGTQREIFAFTAFGENVGGGFVRNGYAGAWGYQSHTEFEFQHVGHRYYDPSLGRFMQRDPIGIADGLNTYQYVDANPQIFVDPSGLQAAPPIPPYYAAGGAAGVKEAAETAAFLACALGAANDRPRIGDFKDPKFKRPGPSKLPRIRPGRSEPPRSGPCGSGGGGSAAGILFLLSLYKRRRQRRHSTKDSD